MVLDTLTAVDRVNLLELYARSSMLIELGRFAEWAQLFEDRGSVQFVGLDGPARVQTFRGRKELLELGRALSTGDFDVRGQGNARGLRTRHFLNNLSLFAETPGRALGYAHLTVMTVGGSAPTEWFASGVYSDRLRKCAACYWRFENRTLTLDGARDASEQAPTAIRA
jgi:hypothetical protein